jgi:hypothetical protein
MAAAAITPRASETAFIPASFPGVNFTGGILLGIFLDFVETASVQAQSRPKASAAGIKDDGNSIVA